MCVCNVKETMTYDTLRNAGFLSSQIVFAENVMFRCPSSHFCYSHANKEALLQCKYFYTL